MRQFTRNTKNRLLIGSNALMAIILIVKLSMEIGGVGPEMTAWLVIAPIVLVFALLPVGSTLAKFAHVMLFLLTGAAIGITIGEAISGSATTSLAQQAWLIIAIPVLIIHYSPSSDDEYLT